jgi:uncharacterized damage-inducible protein DinB
MSISIGLDALLDYSDYEREKWRRWLAGDPSRAALALQHGGRFPTVAALLDHVFLVERRHLARLEGSVPPDSTGVREGDVAALFEYGALVRADFRRYLADMTDDRAQEQMTVALRHEQLVMPCRALATHIVLHEVRHFAQLALAARLAGLEPPGEHDYFYSVVRR